MIHYTRTHAKQRGEAPSVFSLLLGRRMEKLKPDADEEEVSSSRPLCLVLWTTSSDVKALLVTPVVWITEGAGIALPGRHLNGRENWPELSSTSHRHAFRLRSSISHGTEQRFLAIYGLELRPAKVDHDGDGLVEADSGLDHSHHLGEVPTFP